MPIDLEKVDKIDMDDEILIITELDAVNLYEQLASTARDENIRKMLWDITKEEKTHFGEFLALLLHKDKEQVKELEEGKKSRRTRRVITRILQN